MSTPIMVLVLLVIVVAYWFSLWKLYTILHRIEKKLNSDFAQLDNNKGDTDYCNT